MSQSDPSPHSALSSLDESCERAMKLQVAGRLDLAEPIYRSILELEPTHGAANYCIGMLLVQLRRPAAGLPHLLAALNANPEIADYWLGYLEALLLLGEKTQAVDALALGRRHGLAGKAAEDFALRLGLQLAPADDSATPTATDDDAVPTAAANPAAARKPARGSRRREALSIHRHEAAVLALVKEKRFLEALPAAWEMTERFPGYGVGWKIFGAMLWAAGPPEDALAAMHASVRLLPQDAEAHSNLGTALNKLRRLDEAEKWLRHALQIDPNFAAAHSQLGDNFQLQGRYAEAEASFRRAIALHPNEFSNDTDTPYSGLLFMMNHNPSVDADALFDEHCKVGAYWDKSVRQSRTRHPHDKNPDRCLQIAFVSPDLRNHAVASFIEPVLREWQGSGSLRITVYYAYPTDDDISRRLRSYVSRWFPVSGLSNSQLAQKIADDGIDILIDLAGHTAMHRLGAFAHKPAPIQVSWLGYPGTTGLQAMDYYLTDKHFLPPGQFDRYFTEKLAYVPVVWPFQPFDSAPPVNPLPALESGTMTFGSFNRLGKINETTVQLWSQLLRALPTSTIILAGIPLERQHHQLIDWFAAAGIARDRLTVHPWSTLEAHLALHHPVDIGLETTPYTGCTTSNHALWMGVPTLTLVGPTPASRLSAANLGHLGLDEFIAESPDDFVAKGLRWANDLPALAALRDGLRARWQRSQARDPAFVATGIELGLRHMWRRWCAGLPAESFEATIPESATPRTTAQVEKL
jgi:predicted O-linked N-acetylglucosamine transferase (SPINDLY family)